MTDPRSAIHGDTVTGNMKVVRHDPVRERRVRLAIVLGVIALLVTAYWAGSRYSGGSVSRLEQENSELKVQRTALETEGEQLAQKLAILERSSLVDREATNNVRLLVRDLEDEKARLNKDLSFYRSILAPEDVSEGVKLHAFDLTPGKGGRKYLLRLVVSQVARDNPFLRGTLGVNLTGLQDGKTVTLSLLELAGQEETLALGFRYFQSFPENRGSIPLELPEGFTPKTIQVAIRIRSGGAKNVTKTYDWQEKLAVDAGQEQAAE